MRDKLDVFIEALEMKAHQGYSLYEAITYARKALELYEEEQHKINDKAFEDVFYEERYGEE